MLPHRRRITAAGAVLAAGAFARVCTAVAAGQTPSASLPLPEVNNAVLTELAAQVVLVHDVPGLGIAVATRDGLHAFGVAGVRKAGSTDRLTPEDRFHIGSCGKVLTAMLLARLVDEGVLRWDSTVSDVLGGVTMAEGARGVTVAQLLRHRSGLPSSADAAQLPFLRVGERSPRQARAELAGRVLADASAFPPDGRGRFAYSNIGYVLAGHVAEVAAGEPFEVLMRQRVFQPLGMVESGFGPPGAPGEADQPRGHNRINVPIEPGPLADNPAPLAPAGTMHVSLRDWAAATAVLLGGGPDGFLSPAAREAILTPPPSARGDADDPPYAFGLVRTETLGRVTYTHAGSNTLWFARVLLIPSGGTADSASSESGGGPAPSGGWAVLVVTNRGGDAGVRATEEVLQELLALSRRGGASPR
ncbi:MAG: serine hydrolase domain-containing protein [Tepidisphaerales bacterium]